MIKRCLPFLVVLALNSCVVAQTGLSKRLAELASRDTTVRIWVVFREKPANAKTRISARALHRRTARGSLVRTDRRDDPVDPAAIGAVEAAGGRTRQSFRWANAASFSVHASIMPRIARIPGVARIIPVQSFTGAHPDSLSVLGKTRSTDDSAYGLAAVQMSLVGIPRAHQYLGASLKQTPGAGVLIAFFDGGFPLNHRCFDHLRNGGKLLAVKSFIPTGGDTTADAHGAQTLSMCAGYDPGDFMGAAWDAEYVLAHTEQNAPEVHSEEDSWVAALVWAESLGVDIVNSSLGYRYDFSAPDTDYTFADMDGRSTTISRLAAQYATERGMVIVNAMGNDAGKAPDGTGTINAPADAEGVVAVGAVDASGKIASFSSRGPTADVRIKPDLVAMGSGITVPEILDLTGPSTASGYLRSGGTSFSAPAVAGICALIMQSHPGAGAALIRRYLYASCSLLPWQDSVDNTYGRGLPDAYLACTADTTPSRESESFIVYPNVVSLSNPTATITYEFEAGRPRTALFALRTMSGIVVWQKSMSTDEDGPITGTMNLRTDTGRVLAPGVYFFTMRCGTIARQRKVIIRG